MKNLNHLGNQRGRSHYVLNSSAKSNGLTFDDLYEEISDHWQDKARRLQARRWRKIKHQIS